MRRSVLALAAVAIYVTSLAAPAAVGASYLTPQQAQALATSADTRKNAFAAYQERVAQEAKAQSRSARATMQIAVTVGAACDGACVTLR